MLFIPDFLLVIVYISHSVTHVTDIILSDTVCFSFEYMILRVLIAAIFHVLFFMLSFPRSQTFELVLRT